MKNKLFSDDKNNTFSNSFLQSEGVIDVELTKILSRLAKLNGRSVPSHLFQMMSKNIDGIYINTLERKEKAIELWIGMFPDSVVEIHKEINFTENIPTIWIPNSGENILIVLGKIYSNKLVVEDSNGLQSEVEFFEDGVFLRFHFENEDNLYKNEFNISKSAATQYFFSAIKKKKSIFIESFLASLFVTFLALAGSLFSMQVYDRVVPNKNYSTMWVLAIGVLVAISSEFLIRQIRSVMVDRACKAIDNELSLVFFGRALSVRMDARPKSIGTFAAQIKQFEMVRNFMTSSTLFVMADLPCSFIFILMIWYLAGSIAIIPIIFMPLVALIAFSFTGSLKKLALQHQSESNQKNGLLIESVDGIESLKAAMGEWKMLGIWKKLNGLISSRDYKIRTINSFSTNLTQSLQQAAFVLIIILGALSIGRSEITVGALIACSMIIGRALNPINQLPLLISQWQSAKVALADLDKILSLPIDNSNQKKLIPDSCNGDLRFENLKFFYSLDNTALDIQSLNIKAGERIAILGAIGSGKSTLLKILSGLFKPNEGRSLLDGIDMQSIASDFLRQKIGYLPQEVRLFHGSLRDNLVLGLHSPTDEQIIQACRFTGLDNLVSNHPDGLDLSISEGGRGLSGGQRQLAGLTRLFISNPNVILLDEPTASMDEDLEKKLMSNLIKNIESNTTLVFVTHKLSMLLYATRIIVLDRGKILFDGPSSEILKKIGFFPNSERVVDKSVKQSMVFS